jgi:hypothetical protein
MGQLRIGASLFVHVHLRTVEQLNAGHRMVVEPKDLDSAFKNHEVTDRRIFEKCPIEGKRYRTYVARVKRRGMME